MCTYTFSHVWMDLLDTCLKVEFPNAMIVHLKFCQTLPSCSPKRWHWFMLLSPALEEVLFPHGICERFPLSFQDKLYRWNCIVLSEKLGALELGGCEKKSPDHVWAVEVQRFRAESLPPWVLQTQECPFLYPCNCRVHLALFLTLHFFMTAGHPRLVFPWRLWLDTHSSVTALFLQSLPLLRNRPGHFACGAQHLHLPFLVGLRCVTLSLQEANIHCPELPTSICFCLNVRWIYVIALGSSDPGRN